MLVNSTSYLFHCTLNMTLKNQVKKRDYNKAAHKLSSWEKKIDKIKFFFNLLESLYWELRSRGLHADLASRHSRPLVASLQCFLNRSCKLVLVLINGCQPEAVFVGIEVTGTAAAVALDERCGPEVFQTASRAGEGLSPTAWTGTGMLKIDTARFFTRNQ